MVVLHGDMETFRQDAARTNARINHPPHHLEFNSCNLQSPDLEVRAMARTGFDGEEVKWVVKGARLGEDRS